MKTLVGTADPERLRVALRLRALSAIGWSCEVLGERLGVHPETVGKLLTGRGRLSDDLIAAVDVTYGELSRRWGTSTHAINRARRLGWSRPSPAIDADPIDMDSRLDEYEWLIGGGVQPVQAAQRVGVTYQTIAAYYTRAGRQPIVCVNGHRLHGAGLGDCVDCLMDRGVHR